MSAKEDLKLFGLFSSPFVHRVIWALKLKGLEFEYIEEDIFNKSDLLLKYNPVHKKVPVLVHGGRPIAESVVILEYIEEMWPGAHPLLPTDPYERAQARFWTKFEEDQTQRLFTFFATTGEEQAKAVKEAREVLSVLEKEGLGGRKYFSGNEVGMVDLEFGWIACLLELFEEVSGVKVMSEPDEDFPRLKAWCQEFKNLKIVKETMPDQEKLLAYFKRRREMFISSKSS
uniref:glutathione transferase n=1 Tax=Kalanchoe fedtschenkoi TaxID=63787 RepID=A0A7N0SYF1_KALFE